MSVTIAIIGGGAAGMTAAIAAAREGGRVTLYERNERLGKKLLSTGNGKCNLGNTLLSEQAYYGGPPELVGGWLKRFGTEETVSFFHGLGLLIKDRNGYLYPACEQASAVLDVLRTEVEALGVEIRCSARVSAVERDGGTGRLLVWQEPQAEVSGGKEKREAGSGSKRREGRLKREYDRVILACGGQAAPRTGSDGSGYKLAKSLGHTCVPGAPALVQLKCREEYCRAVAGVRADGELHIFDGKKEIAVERGELQLTEYGISGIPVFQLSRTVNYRLPKGGELTAVIDFLPDYSPQEYRALIRRRALLGGARTVEEFFTGMLHKKLMTLFIRLAGLKTNTPVKDVAEKALEEVYRQCREFTLHVTGSNGYDSAQVSAGGVDLRQVTEDLESRLVPGVYFAGELLDVDGRCGGYNLQWAWCSGHLAGQAAAGARFGSDLKTEG